MVSDLCFKGCSIARTACGPTSFRKTSSNIVLGQCVFAGAEVRRLYSRVLKEVRPIDLLVVLRHFTRLVPAMVLGRSMLVPLECFKGYSIDRTVRGHPFHSVSLVPIAILGQ